MNQFWEAMGFVALAFRTGSASKSRTHIFWQKRIRRGDESTPWWFPSETTGGAMRENRLVLPGMEIGESAVKALPGKRAKKVKKELEVIKPSAIVAGGLRFGALVAEVVEKKVEKIKKAKVKNDPKAGGSGARVEGSVVGAGEWRIVFADGEWEV